MKKKINVIDLDKTLIPYDSFRFLIKNELLNLDFHVLRLSLFRILRIILPDEFKHKLVNHLSIKYDDAFFKNYVDRIFSDIDQEVMTLIEKEVDDNTINVLLSASPNLFVTYFIQKLGWVGSGSYIDSEGKFVHLYGQEKVNWLLHTYKKDNFIYNFAISDSSSDNQLLSLFKKYEMDFTLKIYHGLISALKSQNYSFQTFEEFLKMPKDRSIILRHDVDLLPYNSLKFAQIQAENNIKGVYYFRAVPESWNEEVILKIAKLGHEIGYHYENLTTCKGNLEKGILDFEKILIALRKLAPVSTICMHGSPMSKFDSKDLWKDYDYKDYNLLEPYFDVNFNEVFYLTDTGRRWDGDKVSVRDRVESAINLSFHTTQEIIEAVNKNKLPNKIMFTFHPQRWNDNVYLWSKELILQNLKNIIKKVFYVRSK